MSAIVLAVALAAGQVKEPPAAVSMSESQAEQSAMLLANCAGVWDWMGNIERWLGSLPMWSSSIGRQMRRKRRRCGCWLHSIMWLREHSQ